MCKSKKLFLIRASILDAAMASDKGSSKTMGDPTSRCNAHLPKFNKISKIDNRSIKIVPIGILSTNDHGYTSEEELDVPVKCSREVRPLGDSVIMEGDQRLPKPRIIKDVSVKHGNNLKHYQEDGAVIKVKEVECYENNKKKANKLPLISEHLWGGDFTGGSSSGSSKAMGSDDDLNWELYEEEDFEMKIPDEKIEVSYP